MCVFTHIQTDRGVRVLYTYTIRKTHTYVFITHVYTYGCIHINIYNVGA